MLVGLLLIVIFFFFSITFSFPELCQVFMKEFLLLVNYSFTELKYLRSYSFMFHSKFSLTVLSATLHLLLVMSLFGIFVNQLN